MIKLKSLLHESNKLDSLTTFQQLRKMKTIIVYHASENLNFEPENRPLHVGSIKQSLSLIKHMKNKYPDKKFYLYELEINLGKFSTFLFDEDPQIEGIVPRFDSYPYSNRIEYVAGLHRGDNISIVIVHPKEQIISKKLIEVI